jgi:hypothetical protein
MSDPNRLATDELGSTPVEIGAAERKQSPRSFLNSARRNLSEEELKAPGAIRLLIFDLERLDERCAELEPFAIRFHDLRVEKAVLEARLKTSRWHEVLSGLCLAIGSAGIGIASRLIYVDQAAGVMVIAASAILVVAGIASKVFK